ncbi:hypothetical protein N436_03549 [Pseudomonas sp. RV120224-01b]|nr:hypothetical protein N428_03555 [Pseudomonas sp. RV120224-01c]PYG80813.1 hypothetical protein N436_03549 [Pseudomonas sp. RV120224-01b]
MKRVQSSYAKGYAELPRVWPESQRDKVKNRHG